MPRFIPPFTWDPDQDEFGWQYVKDANGAHVVAFSPARMEIHYFRQDPTQNDNRTVVRVEQHEHGITNPDELRSYALTLFLLERPQ